MHYLVRINVEYAQSVEADSAREAMEKAAAKPLEEWESIARSDFEVEAG